jgi:hydroxymethylpyrimidine/phosphomethylpyrimidine kinase
MNHDIWDEFEKIAVSQGLISIADDDEQPKSKARDSLSDDAVRLLYNIEPDLEKKKSIIELAHPETAVVGRAYDAMNSIVENEEQRHDMMAYIALKMPNGNLTQRRYVAAKKDLLDSLIRSAFTLDHQEEEGLMVLADSCAQRLEERQLKKEAIAPAVIGAAAVALLGLGYYFYSGAPPAESVYQNAQKVINAIDGLSDKINLDPIKRDMEFLMGLSKKVSDVKGQLTPIRSVRDSISEAQKASENTKAEAAHKVISQFYDVLRKVKVAIPNWVKQIKLMTTDSDMEEHSEWMSKIREFTNSITDTPEEKLIFALEGKADVFGQIKQYIPGTTGKAEHGGLLGAITQELSKLHSTADAVKEQVPAVHSAIAQEAAVPQQAAQQSPLVAANTPKSPTEDIDQDLLSQLG